MLVNWHISTGYFTRILITHLNVSFQLQNFSQCSESWELRMPMGSKKNIAYNSYDLKPKKFKTNFTNNSKCSEKKNKYFYKNLNYLFAYVSEHSEQLSLKFHFSMYVWKFHIWIWVEGGPWIFLKWKYPYIYKSFLKLKYNTRWKTKWPKTALNLQQMHPWFPWTNAPDHTYHHKSQLPWGLNRIASKASLM